MLWFLGYKIKRPSFLAGWKRTMIAALNAPKKVWSAASAASGSWRSFCATWITTHTPLLVSAQPIYAQNPPINSSVIHSSHWKHQLLPGSRCGKYEYIFAAPDQQPESVKFIHSLHNRLGMLSWPTVFKWLQSMESAISFYFWANWPLGLSAVQSAFSCCVIVRIFTSTWYRAFSSVFLPSWLHMSFYPCMR